MKFASTPMLRITGCSDPALWYAHKVSQLVPHEGEWPGHGYVSREDSGHANVVKFDDAKKVHVMRRADLPCVCARSHTDMDGHCSDAAPNNDQGAGQTKAASAVEAVTNVLIGFVISLAVTAAVLPAYGHALSTTDNVQITLIFTAFSLARSYALRRVFNWIQKSCK